MPIYNGIPVDKDTPNCTLFCYLCITVIYSQTLKNSNLDSSKHLLIKNELGTHRIQRIGPIQIDYNNIYVLGA